MEYGRVAILMFVSQVCSNSWWYCATQQEKLHETPMLALAVIPSILLFAYFIYMCFTNWSK